MILSLIHISGQKLVATFQDSAKRMTGLRNWHGHDGEMCIRDRRMLFDWLVTGHVLDTNPAHAVRGPKHVVKKGKTPVLNNNEARAMLDAIDTSSLIGLRDRALIAIMVYTFARINAVLEMKVGDYFVQGRRGWVRLHEKGGKEHDVPCHHALERYLDEYIVTAGIAADADGPLFRTSGRKTGQAQAMWQQDVYRMIQRRAEAAGVKTKIGNHTFRATGITAYLKNGGTLEHAQQDVYKRQLSSLRHATEVSISARNGHCELSKRSVQGGHQQTLTHECPSRQGCVAL